ncbi:MAG: holo-ACP synthase [Gammaproteobacteria bacterium]|nr:holo-ACP synthase [Gammaproteobacteria bacterium]
MIAGLGVDLVTISRIENVHNRFGERFARRILGQDELSQYLQAPQPARFLAKRFAVKEAAVKALGTGERTGVLLKDFTVTHDPLGKPLLQVAGKAAELCAERKILHRHVSLSDEGDQVVAFVILET